MDVFNIIPVQYILGSFPQAGNLRKKGLGAIIQAKEVVRCMVHVLLNQDLLDLPFNIMIDFFNRLICIDDIEFIFLGH